MIKMKEGYRVYIHNKEWTLPELYDRLYVAIDRKKGRIQKCKCGEEFILNSDIKMYHHLGGLKVEGRGRQWGYVECYKCKRQWQPQDLGFYEEFESIKENVNSDGRNKIC